jgi:hypothetical protein
VKDEVPGEQHSTGDEGTSNAHRGKVITGRLRKRGDGGSVESNIGRRALRTRSTGPSTSTSNTVSAGANLKRKSGEEFVGDVILRDGRKGRVYGRDK